MRFSQILVVILLFFGTSAAQTKLVSPGFNPANYPGRMPPAEAAKLQPLAKQLLAAMRGKDDAQIKKIKVEIIALMGEYAGIPENPPNYTKPETAQADFAKIETQWIKSFEQMRGRNGWEQTAQAKSKKQPPPRLRVGFRQARAYFHSFEAGLTHAPTFFKTAVEGANYLLSEQTSGGVFGYPYDPNAKSGLTAQALKIVEAGEKRGLKMTEGNWIIEDLEEGGLQFDNGEVGYGLLHAFALTGDKKYLAAARRAGDWAMTRPLVLNFNYNGFSGALLARLYRVTGETKYLDAAKDKFIYGVLPGQMENGRWFDQHNASIQYHALMMRQLIEFYLALQKAKDPLAETVKKSVLVGLDNVAEEDSIYGVTVGKAGESLNIEAYALGLMLFGKRENWERAADISVNYLSKEFLSDARTKGVLLPETFASYLLYRRFREGKAESCEVGLEKCLEKLPRK